MVYDVKKSVQLHEATYLDTPAHHNIDVALGSLPRQPLWILQSPQSHLLRSMRLSLCTSHCLGKQNLALDSWCYRCYLQSNNPRKDGQSYLDRRKHSHHYYARG